MIAPMPKTKRADAIREAYLAGLQQGAAAGKVVCTWITGADSRCAEGQIDRKLNEYAARAEAGEKPWKDDEPADPPAPPDRSTSVTRPETEDVD